MCRDGIASSKFAFVIFGYSFASCMAAKRYSQSPLPLTPYAGLKSRQTNLAAALRSGSKSSDLKSILDRPFWSSPCCAGHFFWCFNIPVVVLPLNGMTVLQLVQKTKFSTMILATVSNRRWNFSKLMMSPVLMLSSMYHYSYAFDFFFFRIFPSLHRSDNFSILIMWQQKKEKKKSVKMKRSQKQQSQNIKFIL